MPSFGSQLTYRHTSYTAAAPFSKKRDLPYLPRGPGKGDAAGRPWQGCHNSEVPLPVRLANTAGLRLKSVDGREQVSLSAVLSSRLICQIRSEACGDRSNSLMLLSWRRAPCRYHTAFVPETPYIQFSSFNEESWKIVLHLSPKNVAVYLYLSPPTERSFLILFIADEIDTEIRCCPTASTSAICCCVKPPIQYIQRRLNCFSVRWPFMRITVSAV